MWSVALIEAGSLKNPRIYRGVRPCVCDVCSEAVTDAGNLKRPDIIHTEIKP